MLKSSKIAKLRYRFDGALSRGPSVVISWLAGLTLVIILFASLILTIFGLAGINGSNTKLNLAENYWFSLTRILDPGTFSNETSWPTRIVMLLVTLFGVLVAGSLIGLISSAVDIRIERLRKGRSVVLESDHTLILGWSASVPSIVSEIIIANESRRNPAIVVLSSRSKSEMEEDFRSAIPTFRNSDIICRSGNTWSIPNLELVNLLNARSVVIVGEGSDAAVVKTILAIRAIREAAEVDLKHCHLVAEVIDQNISRSLRSLIGSRLLTVNSDEVVAELTAQACRKRGLSAVFHELLDFDGDEIYFGKFPELEGRTYLEAQLSFEKSSVIGILDASGTVELNPDASHKMSVDDELIAIVEDDSLFFTSKEPIVGNVQEIKALSIEQNERSIAVVGWSSLGPRVIEELDEFFDNRTTVTVIIDPDLVPSNFDFGDLHTKNIIFKSKFISGGPEVVANYAMSSHLDEVIVLGYRNSLSFDDADTRTLLTLLAFEQVRKRNQLLDLRIVAEILDQRNISLAKSAGVDDFVVSDEMTSLFLAQLSERFELGAVFADLFSRDGCSIDFVQGKTLSASSAKSFADIVVTAARNGQTAIGFRRLDTGDVVINPAKSDQLLLNEDDEVLVIARSASSSK